MKRERGFGSIYQPPWRDRKTGEGKTVAQLVGRLLAPGRTHPRASEDQGRQPQQQQERCRQVAQEASRGNQRRKTRRAGRGKNHL